MTDRATLLDALIADPGRAAGVPREEAARLIAEMAALTLVLTPRLIPASVPAAENVPASLDRQLTVTEAAERLGVTPRWIRDHRKDLGAWKQGGTMRIPEKGIERFKERKRA